LRHIFAAADANPGNAFVNACAAAVHLALEARSGVVAAQPYLAAMRRARATANEREDLFVRAVEAWSADDLRGALTHFLEIAQRFPADIASAKWAQYHAFNLGDANAMLRAAKAVLPAHGETAEAWSMFAFAAEQAGHVPQAEEAALQALALKATDPWAHHALAHVYDSRGEIDRAIGFLRANAGAWEDRSIFVREHNWWHLCLCHIAAASEAEALATFDRHLWGAWPEFGQEQIGAISALWRLELAGVDVGDRWGAIVAAVRDRGTEHLLPFHDLHYVYALARAGAAGEADAFLRSMARRNDRTGVWISVALPASAGIVAHARGSHARAAELLGSAMSGLALIGGSRTQRDLFRKAWIASSLNSGNAQLKSLLLQPLTNREARTILGGAPPARALAAA
jgi:tetratricopeptide (TPR) repeat protein